MSHYECRSCTGLIDSHDNDCPELLAYQKAKKDPDADAQEEKAFVVGALESVKSDPSFEELHETTRAFVEDALKRLR
jgi:hypothetical protein